MLSNILQLPLENSKNQLFTSFFRRHWGLTEEQSKGWAIFAPLDQFYPLTNIQTFIYNFASGMTSNYQTVPRGNDIAFTFFQVAL